ncbi:MAG: ATP-binding protein [Oscillospiraceae bacterium]|nr:ATP-binding protein [Oscillospiraceae bacterium]
MIIENLHLKNFTVFEDIEVEFSKGINVFIGENGSGKTHLMKFLYAYANKISLKAVFDVENHEAFRRNNSQTEYSVNSKPLKACDLENDFYVEDAEKKAVFIPPRDRLTLSRNILKLAGDYAKDKNKIPFDIISVEICKKALNEIPCGAEENEIAKSLSNIMGGKVIFESDRFWIDKDGIKVEYAAEAEGLKRIGLLWRLLMNESIVHGSILFWDEPEANINPKLVPYLVDVFLALSRQNVQVFIATHDYETANYITPKMKQDDDVLFHSFYQDDDSGAKHESAKKYMDLENNPIEDAGRELFDFIVNSRRG